MLLEAAGVVGLVAVGAGVSTSGVGSGVASASVVVVLVVGVAEVDVEASCTDDFAGGTSWLPDPAIPMIAKIAIAPPINSFLLIMLFNEPP